MSEPTDPLETSVHPISIDSARALSMNSPLDVIGPPYCSLASLYAFRNLPVNRHQDHVTFKNNVDKVRLDPLWWLICGAASIKRSSTCNKDE